jgi:hypothetical protein
VCKRQESDVWIAVPETAPDPIDTVVALEIRGAPVVYKAPKIEAASDIFVKPLEVKLVASAKDLEIRYTTDGSEPTAGSPIYRVPILVQNTTSIRARGFRSEKPVTGVSMSAFEKVEAVPGKIDPRASESPPGAWCSWWEGDWDTLPQFESLPQGSGAASLDAEVRVERIGLAPATDKDAPNRAREHVALRFRCALPIPEPDVYTFELTSDDGSRLVIDDVVVVDNDGIHSSLAKRGRTALGVGTHSMEVDWFNKSGSADLSLRCAPSGRPLEAARTLAIQWIPAPHPN